MAKVALTSLTWELGRPVDIEYILTDDKGVPILRGTSNAAIPIGQDFLQLIGSIERNILNQLGSLGWSPVPVTTDEDGSSEPQSIVAPNPD